MEKITPPLFLLINGLFLNGLAQVTDHAWLETSQLKVRVNADGRLFCDDEKGEKKNVKVMVAHRQE